MEKARKIARDKGVSDDDVMKLDLNWIQRFRKRRNIVSKRQHGGAKSADKDEAAKWHSDVLSLIQQNYAHRDIYNVNETGLFWKMLPDTSLAFRNQRCSGRKKQKIE